MAFFILFVLFFDSSSLYAINETLKYTIDKYTTCKDTKGTERLANSLHNSRWLMGAWAMATKENAERTTEFTGAAGQTYVWYMFYVYDIDDVCDRNT